MGFLNSSLLVLILTVFLAERSGAEDFKINTKFLPGDVVSADVFNQIFDLLENRAKTIKNESLEGSWACQSFLGNQSSGYLSSWVQSQDGLLSTLSDVQLTFAVSNSTTILNTSTPHPFLPKDSRSLSSTYRLLGNSIFFMTPASSSMSAVRHSFKIDLISSTRFLGTAISPDASIASVSHIFCDKTDTVPAPPSLPVISQNGTSITITWTDNSQGELGFNIYRRASSESEFIIQSTVSEDVVSYSDFMVSGNETYFYSVSATNDNGESSKSKVVSIKSDATPPVVSSVQFVQNDPGTGAVLSTTSDFRSFPRKVVSNSRFNISFSETVLSGNDFIECSAGNITCPVAVAFSATGDSGLDSSLQSGRARYFGPGFEGEGAIISIPYYVGSCLAPGLTISVTLKSDLIKDLSGLNMLEDFVFEFTTSTSSDGC